MKDIAKSYNSSEFENDIYKFWEEGGYFNPDNCLKNGWSDPKKPVFSLLMPPPNVTGVLHLGHALENSLMDIEARFHRMKGEATLFLPGVDHAAVATQARVEKKLISEGHKNPRQEFGREKLLEIIRDYAENSKKIILGQIRSLGSSCDWSRLAYTFDEDRSRVVNEVFVKMYNDGLIYRGYRVVNWSVKGQSTCSDDELEYLEQPTTLYTFKYAKDFPIPIATTRPETKLGDTAVAVHPDGKWKEFIGQEFTVDLGAFKPNKIKIIASAEVSEEFGTGAVGVTPAHSQIDYDWYLKNPEIGLVQVIGLDGKMSQEAGSQYQGLTIDEARAKFVDWLKANDLLISEEETVHNVAVSDRFKDKIEVLPSLQWFVDVNKKIPGRNKSLKDLMREAVTTGHNGDREKTVKIIPERFYNSYLAWIDNLRDWCISRQIWWGHQIPVWYRGEEIVVGEKPTTGDWAQDPDTLDTWFSSGMWTFSTLQGEDRIRFHPTSWMQMGYEILFFWLARMILMTTYHLDEIPFKDVYIHGVLRKADGEKFSKSLDNGIDPLELIAKYGADAVRLALLANVAPGNDSKFYLEKVEHYRNLVNKLWNISRFILMQEPDLDIVSPKIKTLADQWICSRLFETSKKVTEYLDQYQFSQAIDALYDFTWWDFADWYLEIAKIEGDKSKILGFLWQNLVKLWQPLAPFVTQAIWQQVKTDQLIVARWPEIKLDLNEKAVEQFDLIKNLITSIRSWRSEQKIAPVEILNCKIESQEQNLINQEILVIERLARVKNVTDFVSEEKTVSDRATIYFEAAKKKVVSAKEVEELKNYIQAQTTKLANQDFVSRAPEKVIDKEKEKLLEAQRKLAELEK